MAQIVKEDLSKTGVKLEPPVIDRIPDPSERIEISPLEAYKLPELDLTARGLLPFTPAQKWLHEHRRLDMKPYFEYTPEGVVARTGLERFYPGIADKITEAYHAGYTDEMIHRNIENMVDKALQAGYSDAQIEKNLYYGYQDYGFLERPLGSFFYGRPENTIEKVWNWLGTTPSYDKSPIRHEIRAVVERGVNTLTAGLTDAMQKEAAYPETTPGAITGSVASIIGFLLGPNKVARNIIGGRLAPTSEGLRGITQLMAESGANLGLASGISSLLPAMDGTPEEQLIEIFDSTATGALTGALYPLTGAIPSKALRLSVGLAVLDLIRNKGKLSIDDVLAGIKDGTIDRDELAEKSFGYLLDLYYINKVPSMKQQLATLHNNAVTKRILQANPNEAEQVILEIRNANLIPKNPENFLNGLNKWQKITAFGSDKNFNETYQLMVGEQTKLAARIQADIDGKSTIRIPKDLNSLAQKARQFRSAVNFETAVRTKGRLSDIEKESLQKTTKGDLRRFWQGVQDRDYLEKRSMIQHKGEAEKILDAMRTERMYNQADTELQRLNDGKIRRAYQGAARALWDTSANVKRDLLKKGGDLGKEAVVRHDLIKGSGSKSALMVKRASEKIYDGLSKAEEITLNRIIQSRRTIAIEKYRADIKQPSGLGLKEHQAYLDTIPKETFMKLNQRADLYFTEMDNQLGQLYKAGIITRESYAGLRSKGDYSPRRFIQHIDTERTYNFGGKKITVWDSGIDALDEGSFQTLENNSRALLAQIISRTQARIFRNNANKALYNLAEQKPDNGVVKVSEIIEVSKEGKPKFQKPPAGHERVGVMIDGQMREMIMPQNVAKEWVSSDPATNSQFVNIMSWATGAKVLRPMATGVNPEFAVTNLPRDIAHAWLTTNEYSPHVPIAGAQLGKDYAKVFPDVILRRGAWIDYLNEGGGMSFLTHQGGGGKARPNAGKFAKFRDVLGYFGETSEIWTRLALRERALQNGKAPHEATWIARNYLDFSQGGSFIKGMDSAVPYLNAGVQGTRGLFRAAKENPGTFTYKVAEIGVLASGLYLANKHVNPDALDEISDHDKANYFIVTTPLSYMDDEGNRRYLYFRVAKDQSQKLVCTVFENLMAKYYGEDISVDQVTDAARNLVTILPTDVLPPTLDATLGYFSNKDFWRNEDIWKGPEVEPKEEYRATTHPALVKFGELTGTSPERTGYAIEQFLTYGNIYTTAAGGGLRLIMDKLPEDVKEQTTQEMLNQAPFIRRVLKSTDPYTKHAKTVEKARQSEDTRRFKQAREMDAISELVYSGKESSEKVREYLSTQPPQDRERLLERYQRYGRLRDIPDRRWWLNLMDMPPEAAASAYWLRYSQANEEERKRLDEYVRKVPGISTDIFMMRLNQLKNK